MIQEIKIIIPNNHYQHIILPEWVEKRLHENCKCDCLKQKNTSTIDYPEIHFSLKLDNTFYMRGFR